MNHKQLIIEIERNTAIFKALFSNVGPELATWRESTGRWCLLEIVNQLCDEEREDFRARIKHCLETPDEHMPGIRPQHWVTDRKYMNRDYTESVTNFLNERKQSLHWLRSLKNPDWQSENDHRYIGKVTAEFFLANWMAHDYLHMRQVNRLLFHHHQVKVGDCSLGYAGEW